MLKQQSFPSRDIAKTAPVFVVLLLALIIRLLGLEKGIWLDEGLTLKAVHSENFFQLLRADTHPPLYFLLLWSWSQISNNEAFLRILSVFFGFGTVVVVMMWMKQYSRLAALLAGIVCATLPVMLRFSQEIRAYPLLMFASALSFYFASRVIAEPKRTAAYIGLGCGLTIAVTTHVVGIMLLASVSLYLAITRRIELKKAFFAVAIPGAIFLLIYFFFLQQKEVFAANWWVPALSIRQISSVAQNILGIKQLFGLVPTFQGSAPKLITIGLAAGKVLLVFVMVSLFFLGRWRQNWPLLAAALFYWLQLILYSILMLPIFLPRTALPGAVPAIGFVGLQIASIQARRLKIAYIILFLGASLLFTISWIGVDAWRPQEEWRTLSTLLASKRQPNDLVVFFPKSSEVLVRYYYADLPEEAAISVDRADDINEVEADIRNSVLFLAAEEESSAIFLITRYSAATQKEPEMYNHLIAYLESEFGKPSFSQSFDILTLSIYEPVLASKGN